MATPAFGQKLHVDNYLDSGFLSAAQFHREYHGLVRELHNPVHVGFALHQQPDRKGREIITMYELDMLPDNCRNRELNFRVAERTLKYLLWQRGGWKASFMGPEDVAYYLGSVYDARNAYNWVTGIYDKRDDWGITPVDREKAIGMMGIMFSNAARIHKADIAMDVATLKKVIAHR